MPDDNKWFPERVFGVEAEERNIVPLQSQQDAIKYLYSILKDPYGARILFGPKASGKSTVTRRFLALAGSSTVAARLDGSGLTAEQMLASILSQFGYKVDVGSAEDLLRILSVFAVQQTRSSQPPLIVIENLEEMQPAALRALCLLAELNFQGRYALRIVLTGTTKARRLLGSSGMTSMSARIEAGYDMEPLTSHESMLLLHGLLSANKITQPDAVLPMDVCDRIHELSHGNPGQLISHAQGTLKQSLSFPAAVADVNRYEHLRRTKLSMPKLILSHRGEVLQTLEFKEKKIIVGRSSLSDIIINNEYASKFHAMFLLYSDALVLADLKSSNGTFVNSVRVDSTILQSDDIISLASHRIKVIDAPGSNSDRLDGTDTADTSKMKTLDDMREERKRKQSFLVDAESGWKRS